MFLLSVLLFSFNKYNAYLILGLFMVQVGNLHSRMESWCKVIQSTIHVVKDEVPDIVVS